jgi:hypothetical protein
MLILCGTSVPACEMINQEKKIFITNNNSYYEKTK